MSNEEEEEEVKYYSRSPRVLDTCTFRPRTREEASESRLFVYVVDRRTLIKRESRFDLYLKSSLTRNYQVTKYFCFLFFFLNRAKEFRNRVNPNSDRVRANTIRRRFIIT